MVLARDHRGGRAGRARSPRRCSARRARRPAGRATSVESRSPVAGSSPFVRLRTGASPGSARDDLAEGAARHGDDDELGVRDRRVGDRRGDDAGEVDRRAGSAGSARSRRSPRACSGSRQASVTSWPWSRRRRANAVPHEPAADDDDSSFGALDEVDRDGNALELEALAQLVLDPVAVVARDEAAGR